MCSHQNNLLHSPTIYCLFRGGPNCFHTSIFFAILCKANKKSILRCPGLLRCCKVEMSRVSKMLQSPNPQNMHTTPSYLSAITTNWKHMLRKIQTFSANQPAQPWMLIIVTQVRDLFPGVTPRFPMCQCSPNSTLLLLPCTSLL